MAIAVDGSGNVYVAGTSDATWGSPVRAYTASERRLRRQADVGRRAHLEHLPRRQRRRRWPRQSRWTAAATSTWRGHSNATWGSPVRAYTAADDAFVAKLTSAGALTWNTFLGGSGGDVGDGIAVDGSGNVYVAGYSDATWGSPVRAYTALAYRRLRRQADVGRGAHLEHLPRRQRRRLWRRESPWMAAATSTWRGRSDATWGSPVRAYTGVDTTPSPPS